VKEQHSLPETEEHRGLCTRRKIHNLTLMDPECALTIAQNLGPTRYKTADISSRLAAAAHKIQIFWREKQQFLNQV
jgi:hypothetical protein